MGGALSKGVLTGVGQLWVADRDGKGGKTKCGEGGRKVRGKEERTQQEEGRTNSNQSTLRTHQQAAAEKQDAFHLSAP